ncbi:MULTISPECIES: DeoR/GlpR family DNA-binding transcription regulator [Bacillales]|uniref:DeoR/GlpR family DNA-binding transcription regulator n=1 Tax=Lysinibacillus louembei TaxID=1470088 RepID=A0ABZ0S399_9BACI|nr:MULTISPECIES: DeoR/GlpR family DNA-binding transcription regulator [Bacillales]MCT6923870.1 DeoR/GlpR family DNA-binding transcription regulator [Metasolibacillus sp.]MCT6940408.1 DeoR/GlpR family DNA-binding transcription regulator [Metasolibacillus sp.]WPK13730.1 DeoR/GlpR family DNA-binding transcription regulator [Lysinibacillus louembei]
MLTVERQRLIRELLKQQDIVTMQELIEITNASESTIRRDLIQLEKAKVLKRIHGGAARLQGKLVEPSVSEKSSKNLSSKKALASFAANLIEDGDCIYLDAGTTVYEMIPYLQAKQVVVVTNSAYHLDLLIENNIKTYLIGGAIKHQTKAMVGQGAVISLEQYRFDKCFIGANGVHLEYGYTTPDPEEAMIKMTAIRLAQEAYVLVDDSKFNEVFFAKIADLREATIITNNIKESLHKALQAKTNVKVVKA